MNLNGNTHTFQGVMAANHTTTAPSFWVSWTQLNETDLVTASGDGNAMNGTTMRTILAGTSGEQSQITQFGAFNNDTVTHTFTFSVDEGGTVRSQYRCVLAPNESVHYTKDSGWYCVDAYGQIKNTNREIVVQGKSIGFLKIGTASEAVAVRYGYAKDSGLPGAWVPGAPGINGWWTDASAATNAANPAGATQTGSPQLANPTSAYWLTRIGLASSVAHAVQLLDLLWYNTGIAVTTTTNQAIAMPGTSIPSRDKNGTTNGEDWMAGIYVTTATTNAGAVTNTTLSYTNSEGTAGRTATIASFPATAVAGTFVPFQLQAGDRGIRSIQGITLGTSYGGGAISLVLYRQLAFVPNTVANTGAGSDSLKRNIRIYNGTAFWWTYISAATTATNFQAGIEIEDR